MTWEAWKTEAAMVSDFSAWAQHCGWVVYAETAGWDLLLVRPEDGFQIGVEAKLSLNAKVLCQVLEHGSWRPEEGPDCHAVLVPLPKTVSGMETIAGSLGITVVTGSAPKPYRYRGLKWPGPAFEPELPTLKDGLWTHREDWPERCPDRRHRLPEYVPDVCGGHPAPVALTEWKIAALKAQVIIETRGYVTRADFSALKLSPSRWTQFWLRSDRQGGWVPKPQMPDFKAQHPVNYEQIKADMPKWLTWPQPSRQPSLLGDAA